MADNRNFAALDWLVHEIGETLKEARHALENYVENPKDAARIRFCLTHIHQVHGSLQMVEFYGAAMLASEMEQLTQAMIAGTVANTAEAQEVLMRAILQFPLYLDQVKATRKDNPLVVLPLLNDLRAVRGESLLTDTKLFVPNLTPAKKVTGARLPVTHDNVQFQAMVLKLRQMYQYAASGFIRDVNPEENLAYLQKAFSRLQKLTHGTARFALWDICLALVEALEIDAIEISVAIKNLLRQLDKEIKILAVHGVKALNSFTNDELIKNLLYYVARAGKHAPGFSPNSHLQRIYETYHLEEALLEGKDAGEEAQNMLAAPDSEAMRSVIVALKDELNIIKTALDVCLAGGDTQTTLGDALPIVKRVADTMAILGLGDLRKRVLEQGAALELIVDSDSRMTDDQLMAVASQLIAIENALDSLSESSGNESASEADITLSRAKESVLRESRNGLEHAKDAIIEYIASQWNREHLQTVPDTLREIRGGLEIMPLPRPARILGACARYIEEKLLQEESTPEWSTLDTLADAITSVEYYLERLTSGSRREEDELLLGVAEESVAALGYAVSKISRPLVPKTSAPAKAATAYENEERYTDEAGTDNESATEQDEHSSDHAELTAAYQNALADNQTTYEESYTLDDTNHIDAVHEEEPAETQPDTTYAAYQLPEVAPETAADNVVDHSAAAAELDSTDNNINNDSTNDDSYNLVAEEITVVDDSADEDLADNAEADETTAEDAQIVRTTSSTVISREENEDIDDEIIEIFIEEATEVTETIAEYFPRWAQDFNDEESLTEFRRAFHTLKGSGRMVGANEIGELAWSIENMLNRIIDNTIAAHPVHATIIERVRQLLPDMIEAFRLNQPNPHAALAESYRQQALSLSQGVVPPELAGDMGDIPVAASDEDTEDTDSQFAEATTASNQDDAIVTTEDDASDDEQYINETAIELSAADLPRVQDEAANALFDAAIAELAVDDSATMDDRAAMAAPEPEITAEEPALIDIDDPDAQLRDIFAAEAMTHLHMVQTFITRMEEEAPIYEPPSDQIQRALHTLKGSAHMAEITPVAELAAPLERLVKELRAYHVNINDDILQLLRDAVSYTRTALRQIADNETVEIPRLQQFLARVNELRELYVAPLVRQQELDAQGKRPVDPELLAIFMAEEMNLLLDADKIIAHWQATPDDTAQLMPVIAELDKLTQAAAHAYLPIMAELSAKLHNVYEGILTHHLPCSDNLCHTLNIAHIALLDMVDAVAAGQNLRAIPDAVNDALDELLSTEVVTLAALSSDGILPVEEVIALDEVNTDSAAMLVSEEEIEALPVMDVDMGEELPVSTSEYSAEEAAAELADAYLSATNFAEPENLNIEAVDYSFAAEAAEIAADSEAEAEEETIELNEAYAEFSESLDDATESLNDNSPEPEITIEPEAIIELDNNDADDSEVSAEEEIISFEEEQEPPVAALAMQEVDEDFDPEIVEIFIEEARELLEDIDRALNEWQEDWNNTDCVEELKRCLHTFKGGARLAGITDLGDLSHDFETVLIEMDADSELDQTFFNRLNDYQDRMHTGVDRANALLSGAAPAPVAAPPSKKADVPAKLADDIDDLDDQVQAEDSAESEYEQPATTYTRPTVVVDNTQDQDSQEQYRPAASDPSSTDKPNVLTFAPKAKPAAATLPNIPGTEYGGMRAGSGAPTGQVQHLAARRTGPQEVVKVSAELLEQLVNLAGETSISRGRMEQQVSDLSGSIEEMDATIHRLQEQLRRLDIETEAQVLFRQEQMMQHEEFDPLEMDRYSQLQQLSRSLIESASDLMDLKYTLADKTRDTETLLLQQSRINTDLQEGLMRSRMVPFSRLVPRLRRIVRQAATELGKEVDFELDNVEGEMDRTVLERMVAPLEHMLRNAVDHGIEMPEDRKQAGKPDNGRILLTLGREGGDVILRLIDDGRGINLKRVREKAIERGLMAADAHLSDQDVIQFILHAGFSTAEKVTQISGRGVGMDVVHSEIKQLGGAMFIESTWGQGTEFTIRLPFTVSVNRALMVQIGDDLYAIPLNTIEGIVRVSPFELEHYYHDEDARFDYAGEQYLVRYLGTMLDSEAKPKLDGQALPLPVVLVRSAEHTVALQVDRLLGSREIVVKTLGAQFSAVRGVSGATVMGDGSVVVILDLHAMIREQLALGLQNAVLLEPLSLAPVEEDLVEKTVMVVDDSVTVRKVTGRFLEREGFRVITAKDGVEALQLLQDHMPDVMLLDIEMPRMDGFEVAKNIRTSSRLKDIPIIMITSRTGEKHRERAFSLGVNKYMGKPYQEDLLLSNINELLKKIVK